MNFFNRRVFIKGAGTSLALPFLPSLQSTGLSKEKTFNSPKRLVFLCFGWGVTKETWYPNRKITGKNWKITEGLKPLESLRNDFTVIQNMEHQFSDEGHWGSTFYLTGANRYAIAGNSFTNSISVDQVAAGEWGKFNRFSSLSLDCDDAERVNGHGPGLSASWDQRGKPIPGLKSPFTVYHKLFGNEKMTVQQKRAMINDKRSSLDIILCDLKKVSNKLNKTDNDKLNEYLESIRSIENSLAKEESWMEKPKPKAPLSEPGKNLNGYEEIKLMYDLIVAAMQTDSSRVFTYRQPVQSLISGLGITSTAHNITHYARGTRWEASRLRDKKQSELLAYFIKKLKNTKEQDGKSLFDNTTISYGSNISNVHNLNNCPAIIAGNRERFKLGDHLVMPNKTPLSNLWLTLLKANGIHKDKFSDSNGIIKDLLV